MLEKLRYVTNNPQGFVRKRAHGFFKIFGHDHYKRFIILARKRSGSNLLLSYLRSHPQIHAEPLEIFSKLNGASYKKILNDVFSKQPFYVKAAGFKIMHNHPLDDLDCGLWNDLENMTHLHVIHLKRRNILRSLVSLQIAKNQGVWLSTQKEGGKAGSKKVHFDKEELEALFVETQEWQINGAQRFRGHPVLETYYEDLTADRGSEFNRITDFLSVKHIQPKTILKKQNPESLSSLIENYEDLKKNFAGSEWRVHFED